MWHFKSVCVYLLHLMDSGTPECAFLLLCPSFEWFISPSEATQRLRRDPLTAQEPRRGAAGIALLVNPTQCWVS